MPRIRTIKPEFWDSPSVAKASPWARLLFIAMWNWADDYGVGTANPKQMLSFAFPNDDDVPGAELPRDCKELPRGGAELPRICKEVADTFGVVFYEASGRPFYAIPTWEKHQKTERKATGRNPGIDEAETIIYKGGCAAEEMRGTSLRPQGVSSPGTGEQGNRGTGEQGNRKRTTSSSSEVAVIEVRPEVQQLCEHLRDRIVANGSKEPTITKKWTDACRLMLDVDHRTVDEVRQVIDWCQRDSFWKSNILSMPKLRDKFDQLRLAANRPQRQNNGIDWEETFKAAQHLDSLGNP